VYPAGGFQAAHFDLAALEDAKIAVGDGHARVGFGGQKSHPAVNAIQGNRQARAAGNLVHHIFKMLWLAAALFLQPKGIHIHVQHFEAFFLGVSLARSSTSRPP